MNNCELCKLKARTYCESDQASLCWDCDAKVHAANFLVARHSRSLLCHVCNSLTPWKASGEKLGHTVSVCESCVNGQQEEAEDESEEVNDDDDDDDEEVEEEEGDNQVVPWSTITTTPPPASSSSSSSEEMSESGNFFSFKRRREDASDLQSQDEEDGSGSGRKYGKKLKIEVATVDSTEAVRQRSATAIMGEPLKRLRSKRDKGELSDEDSWRSCSRPI